MRVIRFLLLSARFVVVFVIVHMHTIELVKMCVLLALVLLLVMPFLPKVHIEKPVKPYPRNED
ncbi:hypothetical protein LBMAG21_00730 [Armatimonadota bacterium]|nr:hypothetical protein LBMAG21_00730 [Armatimonadota bacterium]